MYLSIVLRGDYNDKISLVDLASHLRNSLFCETLMDPTTVSAGIKTSSTWRVGSACRSHRVAGSAVTELIPRLRRALASKIALSFASLKRNEMKMSAIFEALLYILESSKVRMERYRGTGEAEQANNQHNKEQRR